MGSAELLDMIPAGLPPLPAHIMASRASVGGGLAQSPRSSGAKARRLSLANDALAKMRSSFTGAAGSSSKESWLDWGDLAGSQRKLATVSTVSGASGGGWAEGLWSEAKHTCKMLGEVIRKHPSTLIVPALVAALLMGLGIMAVMLAAQQAVRSSKDTAEQLANGAMLGVEQQIAAAYLPSVSLAQNVLQQPFFPELNKTFELVAEFALQQSPPGAVLQIELMPFGQLTSLYPYYSFNDELMGIDFMSPVERPQDRITLLRTISSKAVAFQFRELIEGGYGALVWFPVFVQGVGPDELFGMLRGPTDCNVPNCYNATTRTKWWGSTVTVVALSALVDGADSRLQPLVDQGLDYELVIAPSPVLGTTTERIITHSGPQEERNQTLGLKDPVEVELELQDGQVWVLRVAPSKGSWIPVWRAGVLALAVLGPLIMGVLLFDLMVSHKRHKDLVANMLPSKVAKRLRQGRSYAESFNNVTVLFSDIVSYTNMSSEMTPEELVNLLNEVYTEYDTLVEKHGLFKVETIGDAFMCVGGCPDRCSPQEAAVRVARMALDMIQWTKGFTSADGRKIQIRVGLYTGDVTAAVVGLKMAHMCLFGDTVNVASRMESNSLPMHVHVGLTTAELLIGHPEFSLEARGLISVKGKGQMSTFWLSRDLPESQALPDAHTSAGAGGPFRAPQRTQSALQAVPGQLVEIRSSFMSRHGSADLAELSRLHSGGGLLTSGSPPSTMTSAPTLLTSAGRINQVDFARAASGNLPRPASTTRFHPASSGSLQHTPGLTIQTQQAASSPVMPSAAGRVASGQAHVFQDAGTTAWTSEHPSTLLALDTQEPAQERASLLNMRTMATHSEIEVQLISTDQLGGPGGEDGHPRQSPAPAPAGTAGGSSGARAAAEL